MNIGAAQPWLNINGTLCEGPLWDASANHLYWTDIPAGHIYRLDWATKKPERLYEGPILGGFTQQQDGALLLFREKDIALLQQGGNEAESLFPFEHAGSTRFNDVIATPEGEVFAGTIGATPTSGALFHISRSGKTTQVASGTGISNGMGFSPDLQFLYWTCSTRRRIYRFPYASGGRLGDPTIFHQGTEEQGYPDGMTVDTEGNIYSARWTPQKHGLIVFNPQGDVIHQQPLPARASTSLCFCGPELRDVVITSAADASDPHREADLYHIAGMPVAGRLEFRSALGC